MLLYLGFIAQRHPFNSLLEVSESGCIVDLVVGRTEISILQIVKDGIVKEYCVLFS